MLGAGGVWASRLGGPTRRAAFRPARCLRATGARVARGLGSPRHAFGGCGRYLVRRSLRVRHPWRTRSCARAVAIRVHALARPRARRTRRQPRPTTRQATLAPATIGGCAGSGAGGPLACSSARARTTRRRSARDPLLSNAVQVMLCLIRRRTPPPRTPPPRTTLHLRDWYGSGTVVDGSSRDPPLEVAGAGRASATFFLHPPTKGESQ